MRMKAGRHGADDAAHVIALKELPVLGSGKTDYVTLNRLAREQVKP